MMYRDKSGPGVASEHHIGWLILEVQFLVFWVL